jgi:membrane-bound lytic murein transglycosylase D
VKSQWLVLVAFLTAACASTSPQTSVLGPQKQQLPTSSDIADLRSQLEEARAAMVARETAPPAPVAVDLDAAVSMPIPDNHFVKSAVALFSSSLKSDIQTYLTRSARYKKMIEKELAEAGLPKGLAYLPVIESGYSTTMTSRAGARGMWQFMGETAREYGLRVDWWVDERADPERSTKIAVQYMKDLYRQFNDWPLALAAYNGGPGRIQRALADNNVTTFWELCDLGAIPKETRGYVPTFYATLAIASDPATYGFKLAKPEEGSLARVELQGPLSLKYLAQVAGVDADTLRDLNPSLRRGVVPPGSASVRVPAKAADAIVARAASLRSEDTDLTVCSYTLRDGDSLKKLARSLGVNVDTLLAMNDLRSPSRVSEGDSVYLPVRARDLGTILNAEAVYHAVEKGDTLYSIAKKYALTVDELRDLNDISRGDKLHRGQKLRVNAPRTLTAGGM